MTAPIPRYSIATGHPTFILFSGKGTIKNSVKDYGMLFDAEVEDDSVHCLIVDPRFSTSDVGAYIVELGGTIYVRPPEPPSP